MSDGWTKTPNCILDAMPFMNELELKLTAALIRQTFGWKRNQVRMTWDDIKEVTSIKGRASIGKAIEMVEARGFFINGRKSLWSINSSQNELFEVNQSSSTELKFISNSSPNELNKVDESSRNELPTSGTKEKERKEKEKEDIPPIPPKRPSLPIHLATQEMMEVWELWLDHQEKTFDKPLSDFTAKRQIKIIEGMGEVKAIAALNHSMDQGYRGIVEPKPAVNGHRANPPSQPTQPANDDRKARIARMINERPS